MRQYNHFFFFYIFFYFAVNCMRHFILFFVGLCLSFVCVFFCVFFVRLLYGCRRRDKRCLGQPECDFEHKDTHIHLSDIVHFFVGLVGVAQSAKEIPHFQACLSLIEDQLFL